eukprot:995664_1
MQHAAACYMSVMSRKLLIFHRGCVLLIPQTGYADIQRQPIVFIDLSKYYQNSTYLNIIVMMYPKLFTYLLFMMCGPFVFVAAGKDLKTELSCVLTGHNELIDLLIQAWGKFALSDVDGYVNVTGYKRYISRYAPQHAYQLVTFENWLDSNIDKLQTFTIEADVSSDDNETPYLCHNDHGVVVVRLRDKVHSGRNSAVKKSMKQSFTSMIKKFIAQP